MEHLFVPSMFPIISYVLSQYSQETHELSDVLVHFLLLKPNSTDWKNVISPKVCLAHGTID